VAAAAGSSGVHSQAQRPGAAATVDPGGARPGRAGGQRLPAPDRPCMGQPPAWGAGPVRRRRGGDVRDPDAGRSSVAADDATAVTAAQLREVVDPTGHRRALARRRPGDPDRDRRRLRHHRARLRPGRPAGRVGRPYPRRPGPAPAQATAAARNQRAPAEARTKRIPERPEEAVSGQTDSRSGAGAVRWEIPRCPRYARRWTGSRRTWPGVTAANSITPTRKRSRPNSTVPDGKSPPRRR
jgi:hypothetical protein